MSQKHSKSGPRGNSEEVGLPYPSTFRGLWIPLEILTHPQFGAAEKILIAEVLALEKQEGAWASNGHYARLLGVKDRMVRSYVTRLEEAGYIRSSKRSSKKRRLWVGRATRALLDGAENVVKPSSGEMLGETLQQDKSGSSAEPTWQAPAGEPGDECNNPAKSYPSTRQGTATENTSREQEEYKENTIADFSLPDWLPASVWNEWLLYNKDCGRKLRPSQIAAHVAELERLHNRGNPYRLVIAHAIENGWKSFFELPPSKRVTSFMSTTGKHVFGGRVCL